MAQVRPCRILWIDTETTGIEPGRCAIVQMSGIITIQGEVKEKFNYFLRPFPGAHIDEEALSIHGRKIREVEKFPNYEAVMRTFILTLQKYLDPRHPSDKFHVGGYYVSFDTDFLRQYFKYIGKNYSDFFHSANLDVQSFVALISCLYGLNVKNYKLTTVCRHFEIPLNPHDAMSDITATRDLFRKIYSIIAGHKEIDE